VARSALDGLGGRRRLGPKILLPVPGHGLPEEDEEYDRARGRGDLDLPRHREEEVRPDGQHLIECDVWVENGKGQKTTQGSATVRLPAREG